MSAAGDGKIYVCVAIGDSATTDSHDATTHGALGDSTLVNYSPATCAPLTLDRDAATLSANANKTADKTFAFGATASDPGSGLDGAVAWIFGDGGTGSGLSVTHTYATAGTFTARATAKDRAGNTKMVNVQVTATNPVVTPTPTATATPRRLLRLLRRRARHRPRAGAAAQRRPREPGRRLHPDARARSGTTTTPAAITPLVTAGAPTLTVTAVKVRRRTFG